MTEHADTNAGYRVLARKYRPANFDELIGQESLVQTLSNALAMGRLAHAFVLTGLRGIGKTTTARIIARGLNCMGTDGNGGPTLSPCGVCSSCTGIADGRHVDVIEMDAASNTGVDDVREIIDGVGYKPLTARFKIYIIDEVHMLSKSAFNALLKTLEEPPEAVKFIFATTEIRKVPVTVLSRCQRFDLRRVPNAMMAEHLKSICGKENITVDDAALDRIARAAEGSVRDALSLLDQAAALTADQIKDDHVADMLGQAGRGQALDILTNALTGNTAGALDGLAQAVGRGAEPIMVVNDLLDLVHLASRVAAGGHAGDAPESEQEQLASLAKDVGMARLGRAWQIMLKGHGELGVAPNPLAAADMLLIRLAHAAVLPTPADLVRKLEKTPSAAIAAPVYAASASSAQMPPAPIGAPAAPSAEPASGPKSSVEVDPEPEPSGIQYDDASVLAEPTSPPPLPPISTPISTPKSSPMSSPVVTEEKKLSPQSLRQMVRLFEDQGELLLASTIKLKMRPVRFDDGQFDFQPNGTLEPSVTEKMARLLYDWTGIKWIIAEAEGEAGPTLDAQDAAKLQAQIDVISANPLVAEVLTTFPGAKVAEIEDITNPEDTNPEDTNPEDTDHVDASTA